MSILRSWRQILVLGVCAAGSAFIGANIFGQPGQPADKKAVNSPKVAVKQHVIEQAHLEVLNGKKAIKFKKMELAELQVEARASCH